MSYFDTIIPKGRYITLHPVLIRAVGGYGVAALLHELGWRHQEGDEWVVATVEKLADALVLTPKQARTIIDRAVEMGVVERRKQNACRGDHTYSYRIVREALDQLLPESPKRANQEPPKRANLDQPKRAVLGEELFEEQRTPLPPEPAAQGRAPRLDAPEGEHPADAGFADFYAAYPRRVARVDAIRAWRKAIKRGAAPEHIVAGVGRSVAAWAAEDPPRPKDKIPYPATWLNDGCYDDDLDDPNAPDQAELDRQERVRAAFAARDALQPARHAAWVRVRQLRDRPADDPERLAAEAEHRRINDEYRAVTV